MNNTEIELARFKQVLEQNLAELKLELAGRPSMETLYQIKTVWLSTNIVEVNRLLLGGWILLDAKSVSTSMATFNNGAIFTLGHKEEVTLPWPRQAQLELGV